MLRDESRVFVLYFSPPLLSCGSLADRLLQLSQVCFSFVLIEFSLKWFFSFFILIALCPLASSRFRTLAEFGTLAEFCTVAEYSFGSLADC